MNLQNILFGCPRTGLGDRRQPTSCTIDLTSLQAKALLIGGHAVASLTVKETNRPKKDPPKITSWVPDIKLLFGTQVVIFLATFKSIKSCL